MKSQIRQNIVEILYFMKSGYGYEIFKAYIEMFPKVTMRSIYYHLRRGLQTEEFRIDRVEKSKGDYSWGSESEKTIYALGENAKPKQDVRVKEWLDRKK